MCEDLDAIMKYWEQLEQKEKDEALIYRKEADHKVVMQGMLACTFFIVAIAGIIWTLYLWLSRNELNYLIPCAVFLILLIFIFIYLEYFLYLLLNQNYTIRVKDNELVYKYGFITKTFGIPFPIYNCDIPFAFFYYEEVLIVCNTADSISDTEPDFNVIFKNLSLRYDTVNREGKSLLDFLMEANSQFLDKPENP